MNIAFAVVLCLAAVSFSSASSPPDREVGDYNFDGHEDYRLISDSPGNQCGWYDYYLFDPAIGDHRLVETPFCKEQFDVEEELVKTRVNGGMVGLLYMIRHYRWEGLRLIPVYAESQNYDRARKLFIRVRVTEIDGPGGPSVRSEILTPSEVGADEAFLN